MRTVTLVAFGGAFWLDSGGFVLAGVSGFAVRRSRCRMGGEVVGDAVPGELVADPDMEGRRQFVGGVQTACHHVDGVRLVVVAVGERGAALAAEASRHMGGGVEFGGLAFGDRETVGGEGREGKRRGRGRSAAGFAVAYAARLRFSFDAVSDRSAQASTFSHAGTLFVLLSDRPGIWVDGR
jgi:hypothetical protein